MHDDVTPTTRGLLRCLHALAEETAMMGLPRTSMALQSAIDACRREAGLPVGLVPAPLPAGVIH